MAVWPNVIEEENGRKTAYDIPSRLLMDRIVMLTDEINSATANSTGINFLTIIFYFLSFLPGLPLSSGKVALQSG